MEQAMCNFLPSVIKEMIGGQMEQLLVRQLTITELLDSYYLLFTVAFK